MIIDYYSDIILHGVALVFVSYNMIIFYCQLGYILVVYTFYMYSLHWNCGYQYASDAKFI